MNRKNYVTKQYITGKLSVKIIVIIRRYYCMLTAETGEETASCLSECSIKRNLSILHYMTTYSILWTLEGLIISQEAWKRNIYNEINCYVLKDTCLYIHIFGLVWILVMNLIIVKIFTNIYWIQPNIRLFDIYNGFLVSKLQISDPYWRN